MPNLKREFLNGGIYHAFNRGVEKRNIFMNESDYYRFIFSLYECNDAVSVRVTQRIINRRARNLSRSVARFHLATLDRVVDDSKLKSYKRELLVDILGFVLMPNHYHLILRQLAEGGISLFMKKMSNSYTGYFNDHYKRKGVGALFQGAFKAVPVAGEGQLMHLVEYIFSNPVEIIDPDWKNRGTENPKEALNFLKTYKWSSYLDSVGIDNFPSVTAREFLWKIFGDNKGIESGKQKIKKSVQEWVENKRFLNPKLTLE